MEWEVKQNEKLQSAEPSTSTNPVECMDTMVGVLQG